MACSDPRPTRLALEMKGKCEKLADPSTTLQLYKIPLYEMMKNETERVARYCVGSSPILRDPSIQERVLMVVGATGAGKSTLINGMVNYILGVEWTDSFRFKLIVEESKSQANSQTSWITAYTIPHLEGSKVHYHLTIVDTPGFGDTRGLARDKEIAKQIKEFFSLSPPNGIDQIHGIGFVAPASNARLTPTQNYVFHSILSIFGSDIGENIFLLLTFADGKKPQVLDAIKKAEIPFREPGFKFNNSALFCIPTPSGYHSDSDDNEDSNFDSMFWDMGVKSFSKFFRHFVRAQSKSLQQTREVLREREQLELLIQGLQRQVTVALESINSLNLAKLALETHESVAKKNQNFTYSDFRSVWKQYSTQVGQYVTNCMECNRTCHEWCAFNNSDDKQWCSAMDHNGFCVKCPRRCHWTQHRNNSFYYKLEREPVTGTYYELRDKYYDAKRGISEQEAIMTGLENDLSKLRKEAFNKILEAHDSLLRLGEIALRPNPLSQVDYIDLLIKSEEDSAMEGWKERSDYYKQFRKQAEFMSSLIDVKSSRGLLSILEPESIEVLIEHEKKHEKAGFEDRVQCYNELAKELRQKTQGKKWWEEATNFKFAV